MTATIARVKDHAYFGSEISENITQTPEGFLICHDVPIARTGIQLYDGKELGIAEMAGKQIKCYRLPEDVFDVDTIASAEGKPFTDEHPPEDVSPENYGHYLKGHISNVRQSGDFLIADILVNDALSIDRIKSKRKRELSCGYQFKFQSYLDGYRATDIRINHVALVTKGRAGPQVRINDSEPKRRKPLMKRELKAEAILSWVKAHDASPSEFLELITAFDEDKEEREEEKESLKDKLFGKKGKDKKHHDSPEGFVNPLMERMSTIEDSIEELKKMHKDSMRRHKDEEGEMADSDEEEEEEREHKGGDKKGKDRKHKDEGSEEEEESKEKSEKEEEKEEREYDKKAKDAAASQALKPILAKLSASDRAKVMDVLGMNNGRRSGGFYAGVKKVVNGKQTDTRNASVRDSGQPRIEDLGKTIMATCNPHVIADNQQEVKASAFWD